MVDSERDLVFLLFFVVVRVFSFFLVNLTFFSSSKACFLTSFLQSFSYKFPPLCLIDCCSKTTLDQPCLPSSATIFYLQSRSLAREREKHTKIRPYYFFSLKCYFFSFNDFFIFYIFFFIMQTTLRLNGRGNAKSGLCLILKWLHYFVSTGGTGFSKKKKTPVFEDLEIFPIYSVIKRNIL